MKIVETANDAGDYPNEKFVNLPDMPRFECEMICYVINHQCCCDEVNCRFWKVVENDYKLQPGFEP